jgi:hypothetical protein
MRNEDAVGKILKGSFTNTISSIECSDSTQRIWVLLDLMGCKTRVGME